MWLQLDNRSVTALHLAAMRGHERIVELLLNSEVVIEVQDSRGRTVLDCAVGNEHNAY